MHRRSPVHDRNSDVHVGGSSVILMSKALVSFFVAFLSSLLSAESNAGVVAISERFSHICSKKAITHNPVQYNTFASDGLAMAQSVEL